MGLVDKLIIGLLGLLVLSGLFCIWTIDWISRLVNTKCMGLVEQWKKMSHSNLVTLRQVKTSTNWYYFSKTLKLCFFLSNPNLLLKIQSKYWTENLPSLFTVYNVYSVQFFVHCKYNALYIHLKYTLKHILKLSHLVLNSICMESLVCLHSKFL